MTRSTSTPPARRYVYGLVRAGEPRDFGCIGIEQDGRPARVHTFAVDQIAAVVSEYSGKGKILPLRRNIEPHHRVIREITKTETIIPMTFGQITKADIAGVLRRNREAILAELDRLDGKVEMDLKVKWDVDSIFEHFVSIDSDLRTLRDEVFDRSRPASHAEKIELGRLFEQSLARAREEQTERVLEALSPHAVEVRTNVPKGDKTVMDLAFLIDRDRVAPFGDKVYDVAGAFPAHYVFEYSGPWAPFSFVELELDPGNNGL